MNELLNIINLFNDCGLSFYKNDENNYCETNIDALDFLAQYIDIYQMLHHDYCTYINYEEDLVVFDETGLEYLGFFR